MDDNNLDGEIFEGFKLSNYSECKEYDSTRWCWALIERFNDYTQKNFFLSYIHEVNMCFLKNTKGHSVEEWKDLAKTHSLVNNRKPVILPCDVVCPCCYSVGIEVTNRIEKIDRIKLLRKQLYEIMEMEEIEEKETMLMPLINLEYPDELIIAEMLEVVKKERKKRGVKPIGSLRKEGKAFTENEMLRWYNIGILPYLDLVIWAKQNNVELPHQKIGVIIFCDPYASYDKKICRLKKEVDDLMTERRLWTLLNQKTVWTKSR